MEAGAQSVARRDAVVDAMPGLVALAVFIVWANESGGFSPREWYPGALLLGALVAVVSLTRGDLLRGHDRRVLLALGALTGFVAWSYLSIAWAQVKGDAWDGANRAALYLIVFALFALWRWTTLGKLLVLGGFSLGIAALGLWSLVDASRSADPSAAFIEGNFIAPVLYRNGNAGLFLIAAWPALMLASRRELPPLVRPLFLAAAGVLVELSVLPQSRGALVVFPLVLVAYFAIVPARLRSFAFFLPVGAALALSFDRLLDASDAAVTEDLPKAADLAAETVLGSAVLLVVAGVVLTAIDGRLNLGAAVQRRLERTAAAVAAVAVLVVAVVAVATLDPVARAESAWDEFTGGSQPADTGESRLLRGFDSNRTDFWRVALDEFQRHPIGGIGSENFGVAYARERRSEEETLYPHSLEMGVLAQTGSVGSALFLVFLAAALASAFAARSRERGLDRALTAGAVVAFVYWFTHASIEWFWELPALTAPALAFLALAGAGLRAPSAGAATGRRMHALSVGVVALTAAACLSFVFPWLAARHAAYAASAWRGDYDGAVAAVERSRRLNPLSDGADLVAGSIERRRQDWDAMARAYEGALERNPHSWYSHLQLALARAKQGRREEAKASVAAAKRLNPSEELLDLVGGWLARGEPVDVDEVAETLLGRHAGVTGVERPRERGRDPG